MSKLCSIEGCTNAAFVRGWCSKHYSRWQRHGDPLFESRQSPIKPGATAKVCPRCANVKPLDQFGVRPNGNPKGYCTECENRYQTEYAATDVGREARRIAGNRWAQGSHGYRLGYRYGITVDDYNVMLAAQGNRCGICRTDDPGQRVSVWSVDHCHATNKVRGLLCHRCNFGLGSFKDDPALLRAAIVYLET